MATVKELFISVKRSRNLVSFKDALAGTVSVSAEPVPGSSESYLTPDSFSRRSIRKLVKFVVKFHVLGSSFAGKLSLDELFYTRSGSLRALDYTHDRLEEVDFANEKEDALFLADSLTTVFPVQMPTDMGNLVELLRGYKRSLQRALLLHPALKAEIGKLTQFGALYMKLCFVKISDPAKYERVISQMPFCSLDENNWKLKALSNKYLKNVVIYRQGYKKKLTQSRSALYMAKEALKSDPQLQNYMHPQLVNDFSQVTKPLKISHLNPAETAVVLNSDNQMKRQALFKIILDAMKGYKNDGSGLVRDLRNSNEHIMDTFLDEMANAMAALTNPPAATPQTTVPAATGSKKRKRRRKARSVAGAPKKKKPRNAPNPPAAAAAAPNPPVAPVQASAQAATGTAIS